MASRFASKALFTSQRGLAAQAATAKKTSSSAKATQLPSGVTVASVDTGSAVSSVAVLVKVGSRNESAENLGASQALRLAATLSNTKNSGFATAMNIEQAGGKVDVIGSREYILYSSQAPRNVVGDVLGYLSAMVSSPAFKPWEINQEVSPRLASEVAAMDGPLLANELLHKAAYREGLGNSLYSTDAFVGRHNTAMLLDFHNKNFTADKVVVIGMDVDHDHALQCAEAIDLGKSTGGSGAPSKFHAGQDARKPTAGGLTAMAVATNAAPASNLKEAMATRLLQYVLGIGPRIKRGQASGQLQKAVSKINGDLSVSAINYSYSDAGLLGALIIADAQVAGQALESVVATIRSANVSDAELAAAKKALQVDLQGQSAAENIELVATNLSLGAKEVTTPEQLASMFANVSLADVQAVAKKLSNAKFTMGATGNLNGVPYIDQL